MKKLALLLLGVLLGFLLCYFFYGKNVTDSDVEGMPPAPKGLIKPAVITKLDRNYNPKHQLISDSLFDDGKEDNRSSWYSLKDIREYLDYAEAQSKELYYTMDGVRIYLGAHDPKPGEKIGMTTMFFVPTGTKVATQKGSVLPFGLKLDGSGDIPGGDGLNRGHEGDPPNANYPQN